jgi:hypothetical protein
VTIQAPIALALVRRADGLILTLQGMLKVDLPGIHVRPSEDQVQALRARLQQFGVYAPRLTLLWQLVAQWAGNQRPVSFYDASGWSGTPTEMTSWSPEEDITKGQRAEVYRVFFTRMRERARPVDVQTVMPKEAPLAKPAPARCPRCGCSLKLRNRKPGSEPRFDCGGCRSAYELRSGSLERIPSLS